MTTSGYKPEMPLISILMAVYEPRMDWLREQLNSLEAQTYPNLRLYIREDCSPNVSFDDICRCVKECIHSIPYEIGRNEKNVGSNLTFELLTKEAEGDYFAYCDQDDVWLPEKIETLYSAIESEQAQLVCSDMFIIDENGKQTANSITRVRRHHVFKSGEGLAPQLLISNFVTGCTMLVRADTAKEAIPFCPYMVHDHYLALYSAEKGNVFSLSEHLIKYRIHSGNQTLMMSGVVDKESYYSQRIIKLLHQLEWLEQRFRDDETFQQEILKAVTWVKARDANFNRKKGAKKVLLKYRRFSPWTSLFEAIAVTWPERLFMIVIEMKRNNFI